MKKIIILFVSLLFMSTIAMPANDEIVIDFNKELRRNTSSEYGHTLPVFLYTFPEDGAFNYNGKDYRIILPDMKFCSDTGFAKEFFTGWENPPFDRQFLFVIGDYKKDTSYIWVDFNYNLDLRDDGGPLILSENNPEIFIDLPNSANPDAKFVYKITKAHYIDTAHRNKVAEYFFNDDPGKGFLTTDPDYWLSTYRYNIIGTDVVINGDSVCIGIMDWDCDGIFNNMDTVSEDHFDSDRICFGDYGEQQLSGFTWDGAVEYLPETVIKIGNKTYEVSEIEESGSYIKIRPTDKPFKRIRKGDTCPDLEYELFDGTKSTLHSQLERGKYNIIYIWASWCSGCVKTVPELNKYDSLYKEKLNIVGLCNWQGYGDNTPQWIKNNGINWTNGVSSPAICETLLSGGAGGFMILLDKELRIVKLAFNFKDIDAYLEE